MNLRTGSKFSTMGGLFSKQPNEPVTEMQSYLDACREDPSIQSFDAGLQARTNRVLNSVAVAANIDACSLSFDSLKEVYGSLFVMNQELVTIILNHQEDIWKNPQLSELVKEYFDNSLVMLDVCTALEKCLARARNRQVIITVALRRFEEEDGDETNNEEKYFRTLEELEKFRTAEDPFTDEFFRILQTVLEKQLSMLDKLEDHGSKINKKIESVKTWRKVTGIIFVAAVVAVVICSVVTAVIAAPPIAAALTGAASGPLGSMGKWVDSLWKRYQTTRGEEGKLVSSMRMHTSIAISDLKTIHTLVDRLNMQIESLMGNADFALRGEEAVKLAIEEIKKNLEIFTKSLEDLGKQASECSEHITRGRTAILRKIIKEKK